MDVTLAPEEVALLERILMEYLSDLRSEIAATDSYEMRTELHKEEETIRRLLALLQHRTHTAA